MTQFTTSLWGDEGWAATLAIKPLIKIITVVARDTSPPFYYLLLHIWMKIFGTSELAIRSLSFIFFLSSVLIVYFIGKILWDKKTGILASLLVFTNPFLFNYAFEGRMYALLLLTCTLSIYFFLKKNRLGFILATTAALYTHHFSIFIVIFEGIWRLAEIHFLQQAILKTIQNLTDFLSIGLFYLPWLYPLYYQTSLVGSGFWLSKPTIKALLETVRNFLVGTSRGNYQTLAIYLIFLIIILRQWKKDQEKSLFLLGWFWAPLFLTFVISRFFQSIFYDRYLLIVIPASSLLIASLRRKFSFILILLVVSLFTAINYNYFFHPTKRPFKEMANYIKQEAAGLTLINYNAAAHHLWESKYYGLKAPIYAPQPLPFYTGTALMEAGDIIKELPEEKELGVITSAPVEEVNIPNYHLLKFQKFGQLSFLWMEKN